MKIVLSKHDLCRAASYVDSLGASCVTIYFLYSLEYCDLVVLKHLGRIVHCTIAVPIDLIRRLVNQKYCQECVDRSKLELVACSGNT